MIRAIIIGFLGAGALMAFSGLWYLPLAESFGFSLKQADHLDSLLLLFMGLGMAAVGWIFDRLRRRKVVIVIGLVGALVATLGLIFMEKQPLLLESTLVILLAVAAGSFFAILYVLVKESVPVRLATTANGMLNTFIFAGLALGQYLPGQILDFVGRISSETHHTPFTAYQWAIMIYLPGIVISLILAFRLRDTAGVQSE